jgi:hypothetical protein
VVRLVLGQKQNNNLHAFGFWGAFVAAQLNGEKDSGVFGFGLRLSWLCLLAQRKININGLSLMSLHVCG